MIEKIGRYVIKEEINRGGMGAVLRAYDPRFGRDVAIKILPPALLNDEAIRHRFEREARIIASIQHPGIVPVHDVGEEHGVPYMVMSYMTGGSLQDRLEHGPMPLLEIGTLLQRLCPALDGAHAQGVIHRDLKPANILFDQYGYAFLADFGIARLTDTTSTQQLTANNAAMGTPPYMSPEQVKAEENVDSRSDIYSLGIILFEMITGKVPYRAETPTKTMLMHVLQPVPSVLEANPSLPFGCEEIIHKALAKNKRNRYQKAVNLSKSFQEMLGRERNQSSPGQPTPFVPPQLITRQHNRPHHEDDTRDHKDDSLELYMRESPVGPLAAISTAESLAWAAAEEQEEASREAARAEEAAKAAVNNSQPPPPTHPPQRDKISLPPLDDDDDEDDQPLFSEDDTGSELLERVLSYARSYEEKVNERRDALVRAREEMEERNARAQTEQERKRRQQQRMVRAVQLIFFVTLIVAALAVYFFVL